MELNEYQALVESFDIVPQEHKQMYALTNLAGEVGELTSITAKALRDSPMVAIPEAKEDDFSKELGDVLFMVAYTAYAYGLDLSVVAQQNINKLESRKARGTLKGSGDSR